MPSAQKTQRVPMAEKFRAVALAMSHQISSMPAFPSRYYIVRFDGGRRMFLRGTPNGEVVFTCQEEITHDILTYAFKELDEGWHNWTATTAELGDALCYLLARCRRHGGGYTMSG